MTPTDLALLGLIAALAYYLANARLTLYGWLLTKDMEEPRKDKIWNQIYWITRFLIVTILAGFVLFSAGALLPSPPADVLQFARGISLLIMAGVVIGLLIFHAMIIERPR